MILLLDDDELILDMLEQWMLDEDFECVKFLDPRCALEELIHNSHLYSLIITDFNMPVMNGLEFAAKVRDQADGKIPIVMVTGNPNSVSVEESTKVRITEVIAKPFDYHYLMGVVNRY